jgi:hypothetical protein
MKTSTTRAMVALVLVVAFSLSLADESKQRSASKAKTVAVQKAEAAAKAEVAAKEKAQQLEEERADDEQEKNRWFWQTYHDKNGEAYFLHSSHIPGDCKGKLRAVKVRLQMRQNEILKELCWHKGEKETVVTLTDPEATFFGTTKIDAASFQYIPSDKEQKAEARRIAAEERSRRMAEWAREMNEQLRQQPPPPQRLPFTCLDLGGGLISCN